MDKRKTKKKGKHQKRIITTSGLVLQEEIKAKYYKASSLPPVHDDNQTPLRQLQQYNPEEIFIKFSIKNLISWFHTWSSWQRRLLICHIMSFCSKQQLKTLATSLEPILHLDFSNCLLPHLHALHMEGVAMFQVQRSMLIEMIKPKRAAKMEIDSLPTTLCSDSGIQNDTGKGKQHSAFKAKHSLNVSLRKIARTKGKTVFSLDSDSSDTLIAVESTNNLERTTKDEEDKEPLRHDILPAFPLIHPSHLPIHAQQEYRSSMEDIIGLTRPRFSSVPGFQSTSGLLKKARIARGLEARRARDLHTKSKTLSVYFGVSLSPENKAEKFKVQMSQITSWLREWDSIHRSHLLTELVKLCDKNLLGFFVQCLYQQIQDDFNINCLSDSLLLKIFGMLDEKDLSRCAQVCKRWNFLANSADLWRQLTLQLGQKEGVGDLAEVIEVVVGHYRHSLEGEGTNSKNLVDWKRAYRDLLKLVLKLKEVAINSAEAATKESSQLKLKLEKGFTMDNLSLAEMLAILRITFSDPNASVLDLVRRAPESDSAKKRRLREQRKAKQHSLQLLDVHLKPDDELLRLSPVDPSMPAWTPSNNLEFIQHLLPGLPHQLSSPMMVQKTSVSEEEKDEFQLMIERVDYVTDIRPHAPQLPDPIGIRCVILSGGLILTPTPKPGKTFNILKAKRMLLGGVVLCVQCDTRKIIIGTSERVLHVIDIKSGRVFGKLHGHKGSVHCLQFDDYKIVSGSWDSSLIVWDVVHHTILKVLSGHTECVSCLQFDEDILVSGSLDGSLRVWSTATWDIATIMSGAHPGGVTCLKFNSVVIASGGNDKCVKLWSANTFRRLGILRYSSPLTCLNLSQLLLATCCRNGRVTLWNLYTGKPLVKRQLEAMFFQDIGYCNGRYYGAGSDGVIYEIDLCTGTCIRLLKGHTRPIKAVWADNRKIISVSSDMTILMWYFKKGSKVKVELDLEPWNEIFNDSDMGLGPRFEELPVKTMTADNFEYNFAYIPL